MNKTRTTAAIFIAVVMFGSAILHLYWVLGGEWFLATAAGEVSYKMSTQLKVLTWVIVPLMLLAIYLALGRIGVCKIIIPQKFYAFSLWVFTACMFGGVVLNVLTPRFWDRYVFASIFLMLAISGLILALPYARNDSAPNREL